MDETAVWKVDYNSQMVKTAAVRFINERLNQFDSIFETN